MKAYKPAQRHMWAVRADLRSIKPGMRYSASRVLHALAHLSDQHTLTSYYGFSTIAREAGVSDRTARNIIPLLESAGLILVNRKRRRGNLYMLIIGDLNEETMSRIVGVFRDDSGLTREQILAEITASMSAVNHNGKTDPNNGNEITNNGKHVCLLSGETHIRVKDKPPISPLPKKRRKPTTDPPESIEITDQMLAWARQHGIAIDLHRETDTMLDYYRAQGKQMADWYATWRNWMKRSQGYESGRAARQPTHANGVRKNGLMENIRRVCGEKSNGDDTCQTGFPFPRLEVIQGHRD